MNLVRKNKIECIHAHSSSIYWSCFLKIFFPRVKIIWHDHFGNCDSLNDGDRKSIKIFSFMFDAIISVNQKLKNWSIRNTHLSSEFIFKVNNFALLKKVKRKSLSNQISIINLANFRHQKDHANLIKAISIVKKKFSKPFKLLLIGKPFFDDYYYEIKQLINDYNLNGVIDLIGPVANVCKYLEIADLGVISSRSEGLPVCLLEFGLVGMPVVSTDVGDINTVLKNGKNGVIVPSENSSALADGILMCLRDKNYSKQIGSNLKETVSNEFSKKSFLFNYNKILKIIS